MWYCCLVFFFKQKTAYEMRISDWSSDVCSSDLLAGGDGDNLDAKLVAELAAVLESGLVDNVVLAKNEAESGAFWRLRDSISEAERADGPALQHDVSVPVDLMPRFIAENPGRLAAAFPGVRTLSFGHLGDGNVHHHVQRSEEHTSELQSLMRISYAVFCW